MNGSNTNNTPGLGANRKPISATGWVDFQPWRLLNTAFPIPSLFPANHFNQVRGEQGRREAPDMVNMDSSRVYLT